MDIQLLDAALFALRPGAQRNIRNVDGSLVIEWLDANQAEPTSDDINLWIAGQSTRDLIAYANAKQWALATGGYIISFSGGPADVPFGTDATGMALLNGKIDRFSKPNPPAAANWQTGPTTCVSLTPAQIETAGVVVADFIQATFDMLLAVVVPAIESGTITTTDQIDVASWPANSASLS